MENQNFSQQPSQGGFNQQLPLPNSTGALVLGILSIVFCWSWGIAGLILGIIALSLSGKANSLYQQNPNTYSQSSYNNMKAGRVCAIIGTILSGLFLLYVIIVIAFIGTAISTFPWQDFH